MQVHRANFLLVLGIFFLLSTLYPGPTRVHALTSRPRRDPMYYYPGKSPGEKQQRRPEPLTTIPEEVGHPGGANGRAPARVNRRVHGNGGPPITPFGFQAVRDHRNRPVAPEHRAPQGFDAFINQLQAGLMNIGFGRRG
ncbi:hypothetical protein MTO96_026042 [Rhipicephalus appendiculatus]